MLQRQRSWYPIWLENYRLRLGDGDHGTAGSDIPLLLFKTEMKNLNLVLDLAREEVKILGETRRLLITRGGLPAVRLQQVS